MLAHFRVPPVVGSSDMKTILLLMCSDVFMTIAWYGHLKYRKAPLVAAIVVSGLIAFFEFCSSSGPWRSPFGESCSPSRGAPQISWLLPPLPTPCKLTCRSLEPPHGATK